MNDGKKLLYRINCTDCACRLPSQIRLVGFVTSVVFSGSLLCYTRTKRTARQIIDAHRTRTKHKGQSFQGRYVHPGARSCPSCNAFVRLPNWGAHILTHDSASERFTGHHA